MVLGCRFWSLLTVRAAAMTPAQWAVKAFIGKSLYLIFTGQALTCYMDPPACAHTHTQENTHCSHTLYLHQGFIQTLSSEMCVCVTCHTADTAWWVHHACTVSDTGDSILDCHMVHNDCSYPANHSAPQERRSHTGYTSHTWRQHRHTIREESPETGIHCWQRKTTLPLALPGSFRYCVKGWVQTVGVVTDVTVIT